MNILIPMAGLGSRFSEVGYKEPKPLIDVAGEKMISLAVKSLGFPDANTIFITRKYKNSNYNRELNKVLSDLGRSSKIIELDHLTEGPASTCLVAKELINNDQPLIIANCDQVMLWNPDSFLKFILKNNPDGAVITYTSEDVKNSFVEVDNQGQAVKFTEKIPISNIALNGVHYWKKGSYFVESAEEMISARDRFNGEFYIAPSFNFMINKKRTVLNYHIEKNECFLIGTPKDLNDYINFIRP